MTEYNYVSVGQVINTHGIKGEVRVKSLSDFANERFQVGETVYLNQTGEKLLELTITRYRLHKKFVLLTFDGFDNINKVEPFVGGKLQILEEDLNNLNDSEFYIHDIIGLSIYTDDNQFIGKVNEILETPANDVWVVKREGQKDLLLPFIESVILSVNLDEQKATVHILEGLDPEDAH